MGRKGKKKSKAQLETELKKAAEELWRSEEKQNLLTIEEDLLARHKQRLAAELDGRDRVLEAERLEEEQGVVTTMKTERKRNLVLEQSKLQDQINWQKFISCNTRPNVAFENEITTYMTMVREERVKEMQDAMTKCRESEDIVGDLMELYCKAREDGDVPRQEWCMRYIYEIRKLEIEQIDDATAHLLQYIEKQDVNNHWQVFLQWGNADEEIKVGFWGYLQSKGFRAKQIDHAKLQIGLDLPKSIALQTMTMGPMGCYIGVRSLYSSYDCAYGMGGSQMSVGGMIRVDLLSIPPFSKKAKTWTIRQVPPPGSELTRLPYPNTEHTSASTNIAVQPCKIEYKVPAHVLVRKNPTVSWWDTAAEKWSTDGINEILWEQETRKISFFSQRLAAFAMTQERHLDLPYKYWSIRPINTVTAELTIQAARYELHFIISEDGLRLKGPNLPELHDVMYNKEIGIDDVPPGEPAPSSPGGNVSPDRGQSRADRETTGGRIPRVQSPARLLTELRECGLNLLPEDADAEFLEGYTPKHIDTQTRAYYDLSEIAAFFDIASSRHNKNLPSEKALVRIRENAGFHQFDPLDPDCDTDYRAILFFPDKSGFVQSLEEVDSSAPCNETAIEGHVTHASLHLCFDRDPKPPPTQAERLQRLTVTDSNVRFVEAVRQTMQLMRLLCFV